MVERWPNNRPFFFSLPLFLFDCVKFFASWMSFQTLFGPFQQTRGKQFRLHFRNYSGGGNGSISAEGSIIFWLSNLDERTFLGIVPQRNTKIELSLQIDRLERLNGLTTTYSAQREQVSTYLIEL